MTIGKRIKELRKNNKITQKQLSELTGIAEITIRQYEADKYIPKIGNLQKISTALHIPLAEFLNISEDSRWSKIADEYPDSPVIEKGNELYVSIFGDEESAYINRITFLLNKLNLDGLQNANSYVTKLTNNSTYLKNSSEND